MKIFITKKYIERKFCTDSFENYEEKLEKFVKKKVESFDKPDDDYSNQVINTENNSSSKQTVNKYKDEFNKNFSNLNDKSKDKKVVIDKKQIKLNDDNNILKEGSSKYLNNNSNVNNKVVEKAKTKFDDFDSFEFDTTPTSNSISNPNKTNSEKNVYKNSNIVFPAESNFSGANPKSVQKTNTPSSFNFDNDINNFNNVNNSNKRGNNTNSNSNTNNKGGFVNDWVLNDFNNNIPNNVKNIITNKSSLVYINNNITNNQIN